jgi:hypothetical protein
MRGSRGRLYDPAMRTLTAIGLGMPACGFRWMVALALSALVFLPRAGFAAEPTHCLSGEEQRAALAGGKVVPLGSVIHALHRAPREVVKARLCQEPDRLIYLLTLLGRDGKVKVATVDAANGAVVGER